ncbi:cytochrome P450 [Lentinula raphanica]|nr:cytochrome P450 [Lentinula raphanica]
MYFQLSVSLLFVYVGVVALYRLYFHPLCKYPGPVIAALTDWYELYHNIIQGGALLTEIDKLHKLHGTFHSCSSNELTLHFTDRNAYHDIYSNGTAFVKEPGFYLGFMAHAPSGLVSACDPEEAKLQKSLLGPMFSRRAVLALESTVQKKVDQLVSLMKEHYISPSSSIQMASAYRAVTTDVITEYCFAQSADTMIPGFDHPIQRSVQEVVKRIWIQRHFPFLNTAASNAPQNLVEWLSPEYKSYVGMRTAYEHQIDGLLANPDSVSVADHETIYHHLLNPKNRTTPSRRELIDQAFTLLGAGSDTVGNVCTVGTFYALKYPSIAHKLSTELSEAWPDEGRPLGLTVLEKLPYLTAFIKEALRFSVGVIHPMPRQATTTVNIAGFDIAPGTIVEMSTAFLHLNPDVFPDPYTFNPNRWLVEDTNEMNLDFVPFSKGPRSCVGLNLAWCELYLIFGNIFRKFNMKLHDEEVNERTDFRQGFKCDLVVSRWHWEDYRVSIQPFCEAHLSPSE